MATKKAVEQADQSKSIRGSRKKRARRPKSKLALTTSDAMKSFRKDVMSLLRGSAEPGGKAWIQAREIVKKLIVETDEANINPSDKILFLLSCAISVRHLPGYATLDLKHIEQISLLIKSVERYVDDASQKRPLNFLMLASPGAGKSHFIKCVAASLQSHNVGAITFNMAGLQRNEDLIPPLDAARNLKVEDRIPLLFLDEFDSAPGNVPLLLPLLWDGELNLGQRDLKLGKVVIVLAGSDPVLPITMDHARSMRIELSIANERNPKVIDLLSRINGGVIPIPPFYDPSHEIDRRFDKVCIATQLLRLRFGSKLRHVPLALLRFLARTEFRYGVRSIAHLIELIPYKKDVVVLKIEDLQLPIDDPAKLKASSLAYHLLHDDQAHGVTKVWETVSTSKDVLPVFADSIEFLPQADRLPVEPEQLEFFTSYFLGRIEREIQATDSLT
jgi:hypothetical protein